MFATGVGLELSGNNDWTPSPGQDMLPEILQAKKRMEPGREVVGFNVFESRMAAATIPGVESPGAISRRSRLRQASPVFSTRVPSKPGME
jgi:hypothetical protein